MAAATDYLEAEILDHILGTGAFTMPTQVYVKLHLNDPTETGAVAPAVEDERKEATFAAAVSPGGTATTSLALTWTNVAATETYSHWSIWDDLTAGNALLKGALTAPVAVTLGDTFEIAAGDLTITAA